MRGWAPCGKRLIVQVPRAHWQTCALIAALRHDRVETPWRVDGPVIGACFRASVERGVTPTPKPPGIFIRDNLGSLAEKVVRRAIRAIGATLLFVVKDSRDLNPSEQVFNKLKYRLHAAAKAIRDAACNALARILDSISPAECANDLVNGGRDQSSFHPVPGDRAGRRRWR